MLTRIWLDGRDRIRIREAANRIDQRLALHPETEGESREMGIRVAIEEPLVVYFRVHKSAKLVTVTEVLRPKLM